MSKTLSKTVSRELVWQIALEAKLNNSWCDEGFNEAMGKLGFPAVETFVEFWENERPDGLIPTPKDAFPCEDKSCNLCWNNPLPASSTRRMLRFVDTGEIIREA